MYTLGINADMYEGAACLVRDGVVVAAADEARLRPAHGERPLPLGGACLPAHAIAACLAQENIALHELEHVASDLVLGDAFDCTGQWHHVGRQAALEAGASLAAPFQSCAVLVSGSAGAMGEATYGVFERGAYRRLGAPGRLQSLAQLSRRVARHLGLPAPGGEANMGALAAYGRPGYVGHFRQLVHAGGEGCVDVVHADLGELLGPPRLPHGALEQRHMDVAHSLQRVLEDTFIEIADWLHGQCGQAQLSLAGHFAGNWALATALRARSRFQDIWVQPAGTGATVALGAALLVDAAQRTDRLANWSMDHVFLGPQFFEDEIESLLRQSKLAYRRCGDIARDSAALLAQNKVLGWFQGRMEVGPETLGARSILAAATDLAMQDKLNSMCGNEDFLPIPGVVLAETAGDWFMENGHLPCMQLSEMIQPQLAHRVPALRHVDGTARTHAIEARQHALLHELVRAYGRLSGIPVLAQLPFGLAGEPVAATPRAALEYFCSMPLDALAIGPFLLEKSWLTAWRGIP